MFRALPTVVAAVVTSAGCAQLVGIDNTSGKNRNTDTVAIQRASIGTIVVPTDLDLSGLQASYLVEDPASATGFDTVTADNGKAPQNGTWHADLPDPAAVMFTLPDVPLPVPRLFTFPNRALRTTFGVLEHPGPTPAPDGAMLTVTVTAPLDAPTVATDTFEAVTIGSWTSRQFPAGDVPVGTTQFAPPPYPFSAASSTSGRPGLDRLTTKDAFLILRYSGTALTGVAEATPFDQTGVDLVVAPAMVPVIQDQTLDVKVNQAALNTRYAGVRPAVAKLAISWTITAAPGSSVASSSGPLLQSAAAVGPAEVGVLVKFGNPFAERHWGSVFALTTSESRVFTPAGTTTSVTLFAAMIELLDLSPAAAPPAGFQVPLEAGLPVTISLGNTPLLSDGQVIPKPTRFVDVSFLADSLTATLFELQVYDLLPNAAGTMLEYHLVLDAEGVQPTFKVPPDIFQVGHSYTLRVLTTSGSYPGILDGDLQTRTLPQSVSLLDSAVFTVTP